MPSYDKTRSSSLGKDSQQQAVDADKMHCVPENRTRSKSRSRSSSTSSGRSSNGFSFNPKCEPSQSGSASFENSVGHPASQYFSGPGPSPVGLKRSVSVCSIHSEYIDPSLASDSDYCMDTTPRITARTRSNERNTKANVYEMDHDGVNNFFDDYVEKRKTARETRGSQIPNHPEKADSSSQSTALLEGQQQTTRLGKCFSAWSPVPKSGQSQEIKCFTTWSPVPEPGPSPVGLKRLSSDSSVRSEYVDGSLVNPKDSEYCMETTPPIKKRKFDENSNVYEMDHEAMNCFLDNYTEKEKARRAQHGMVVLRRKF
uniref:WAPL domain-containing protein n=1 Tax=Steinernema glaseri TaxID=37863 RepID=A0A1I7YL12_9BILA